MFKELLGYRKYLILGAIASAPLLVAGCDNCGTAKTDACAKPSPCAAPARSYRVAAPRAVTVRSPRIVRSAPVVVSSPTYAATSYAAPVVYQEAAPASGVVYKPIASRSYAAALTNVEGADVVRTSAAISYDSAATITSAGSAGTVVYSDLPVAAAAPASASGGIVSSVITRDELAAVNAGYPVVGQSVAVPAATASYPVAVGQTYPVPQGAASYVVADGQPAYTAVAAAPQEPRRAHRGARPAGRRPRQAPVASASVGIPSGTPVYITPGGTAVTSYVPAPASGTYLGGAAPTGYLPVTERRGPDGAVIHYATRSICEYDPARGEDCVWTSGF